MKKQKRFPGCISKKPCVLKTADKVEIYRGMTLYAVSSADYEIVKFTVQAWHDGATVQPSKLANASYYGSDFFASVRGEGKSVFPSHENNYFSGIRVTSCYSSEEKARKRRDSMLDAIRRQPVKTIKKTYE